MNYFKQVFHIEDNVEHPKISKYLVSKGISRRILKRVKFHEGKFIVNGKEEIASFLLKPGDHLEVYIPNIESSDNIPKIDQPIEILYEDEYYLIANKPPFLPSIPKRGVMKDNAASRVKNYLFETTGSDQPIHLITRLDTDTSGVIFFAKNSLAHSMFFKKYGSKNLQKTYFTLAKGRLTHDFMLMLSIGRSPEFFLRRVIDDNGKMALSYFKVEEQFSSVTRLSVSLLTGRTHQIRVHLSGIDHPILGDLLYGGDHDLIDRQALHCAEIVFDHPFLAKKIRVKASLPDDLTLLLEKLRHN